MRKRERVLAHITSSGSLFHGSTGSLGYADDLTLLAPTLSGLQVLIKMCERYADEFDIKFNGAKSVCTWFLEAEDANATIEQLW